jgi:hypothetical protein
MGGFFMGKPPIQRSAEYRKKMKEKEKAKFINVALVGETLAMFEELKTKYRYGKNNRLLIKHAFSALLDIKAAEPRIDPNQESLDFEPTKIEPTEPDFREVTKREIENLVTPEFIVERFKEFLGPELAEHLNPEAIKALLSKPRETKREPAEKPEIKKEPVMVRTKHPSRPDIPPEIEKYRDYPKTPKDEILPWLFQWKEKGYGFQSMASALNEAGIPNTSGKGKWHKGTIGNMVKE